MLIDEMQSTAQLRQFASQVVGGRNHHVGEMPGVHTAHHRLRGRQAQRKEIVEKK